ncbi:MAG: HigA family addiction module antitoxin [Alphaproteobacteria bacterium]|nr:HigA family addiction module antitoxin [Alphaproteobacteria bacterium]
MIEKEEYIEIHIGEFLEEEFLKPLGISANALAIAIKVPATRIYDIFKGTRGITLDTDLRLCKYFGMSNGFFLNIQTDIDLDLVKRDISKELDNIIPYKSREKLEEEVKKVRTA